MSLTLIIPPTEEPVTLAAFKEHIKADTNAEDASLSGFLLAARRWIEARYSLALVAQGWRLSLDCAEGAVTLPLSPVLSIDSVGVVRGGITETLGAGAYEAQTGAVGRVRLKGLYPGAGLVIAFTAGWPSADDVPEEMKLAIKLSAARSYEYREGGPPSVAPAVDALLSVYRRVQL
ncbi:MAG: hypothetical protein U5J99_14935 [Parvularculaceae bacterium]|nr:hypothetical protein [Parvularculaceae bacterium]